MIGLLAALRCRRAPLPPPDLAGYRSQAATHVGRVRRVNEDRVLERPCDGLWAVADGMGGLARGDQAAEAAIAALAALPAPIMPAEVLAALADVDASLRAEGGGGGTTIVALLADDRGATLFWSGDSRAYRIGDAGFERLTRDHSLVEEFVVAGLLSPEEADRHPQSNIVTRALGAGEPAPVETLRIAFAPGDRLLLASDGCYRALAPEDADDAEAERLVAAAVARDGTDNASCVMVERRG